jgi:Zn2+/Cd2+-exporting ATPase
MTTINETKSPFEIRQSREKFLTALTLFSGVIASLLFTRENFQFLSIALFAIAYIAGGYYGVIDSLELLRNRNIDINLLMILAAIGAAAIGQPTEGVILLFLFSLSNTLQTLAIDKSRKSIKGLLTLRPSTANVKIDDAWVEKLVEDLEIGQVVLVKPGENLPVDGKVVFGNTTINQASITGESLPATITTGDFVYAGTLNINGSIEVEMTKSTEDTTLAKIVSMVEKAQEQKAVTERTLDKFEKYYSIFILVACALIILIPIFLYGKNLEESFYKGMVWLVVASPCALVISTPASILSAIANSARNGVLFKGGAHLENTAKIKVLAFDKTGTLTLGKLKIDSIHTETNISKSDLLAITASAESHSEHLIATAIVDEAKNQKLILPKSTSFMAYPGLGIEAVVKNKKMFFGNVAFVKSKNITPANSFFGKVNEVQKLGHSVVIVFNENEIIGFIAIADSLRPDVKNDLDKIRKAGISRIVMLTGDNQNAANHIASQIGIDDVYSDLLPDDKVNIINKLISEYGPTAMVGDGINDAPALAIANVGIAMGGAGTDIALQSADIVLMADNLGHIAPTIALAKNAQKIVWQNIFFSIFVIMFLIVTTFWIDLPLTFGVIGHEGSTVIVVLNGLRLLNKDFA